MRARTPTIHCDGDDGDCGAWDMDHYETCASSVGGISITQDRRAPGWVNSDDGDYCPEHAKEVVDRG